MPWLPGASDDVVQPTLPETSATATQPPMSAPPSLTVTLPAGVPKEPETVSVRVTGVFASAGFGLACRSTVGVAFAKVTATGACRLVFVPSPTWPASFKPQHRTPLPVVAQVWL